MGGHFYVLHRHQPYLPRGLTVIYEHHLTFNLQVSQNGHIVLVIGSLAEIASSVIGLQVSDTQGSIGIGEKSFILKHRGSFLIQPRASRGPGLD